MRSEANRVLLVTAVAAGQRASNRDESAGLAPVQATAQAAAHATAQVAEIG